MSNLVYCFMQLISAQICFSVCVCILSSTNKDNFTCDLSAKLCLCVCVFACIENTNKFLTAKMTRIFHSFFPLLKLPSRRAAVTAGRERRWFRGPCWRRTRWRWPAGSLPARRTRGTGCPPTWATVCRQRRRCVWMRGCLPWRTVCSTGAHPGPARRTTRCSMGNGA